MNSQKNRNVTLSSGPGACESGRIELNQHDNVLNIALRSSYYIFYNTKDR